MGRVLVEIFDGHCCALIGVVQMCTAPKQIHQPIYGRPAAGDVSGSATRT